MQIRSTYNHCALLLLIFVFITTHVNGQESKNRLRSIGVGYYGELGLHPGILADVTFQINDFSTKRFPNRRLLLRPSLIYFYRPYYTHNYMALPNLLFQMGTRQNDKFLLYFEVGFKVGYLRYQYSGDQYISTPTGIQSIKRQGGNGFVYGLGFLVGIKSNESSRSYFLSLDYLNEQTEDSIQANLFAIKLGVRFDQIQKQKSIQE